MTSTYLEWEETEKDTWPKALESGNGDLLYIEDNLDGQTEISDEYWEEGRYTVKLRPGWIAGRDGEFADRRYESFDDLDQAEAYLDGLKDAL